MAKIPTKPAKAASESDAKEPAKNATPAKPSKSTAAVKEKALAEKAKGESAEQVSHNAGDSVSAPPDQPSSKSTTPPESASPKNISPDVKKSSSKTAKTAPAADSVESKPEANGTPAKPAAAAKTPAPAKKVAPAPVRMPVAHKPAPDELPEIVIPKKSPFSTTFLKKQKQRLLDLRSALLDAMEGVAKDSLRTRPEGSEASVGGMHMGDAGSDAYDRDFALSLLSKEQDALYEINDALKRIDLGSYGICEMTSKPINEERLEALPFARFTREAQETIERDQQGGRNRRVPVRSVFGLDDEESEDDDDEEEGGSSSKQTNNSESSLDFIKD